MAENITDIYIKSEQDPLFNSEIVETKTIIEGIISKIYMILFTKKGEVLGEPDFGADIPNYLWKTRFPASTIQTEIQNQINTYCPELNSNTYNVNVFILPGTIQDIGVIQISIGTTNIATLFK